MRLIQLLAPREQLDSLRAVLDDEGVDYVSTPTADDDESRLVYFPLPTQAVDHLFESIEEAGLDPSSYAVIASAETARTPGFEDLEKRFVEGGEVDDRISNAEIRSTARALTPGWGTYYAMTLLSAVVATAGLLLDSPAVVVGSMVIAPQVGSALTASVGAVFGERGMVADGLRDQALSLGFVVAVAALFGFALQSTEFLPTLLDVETVSQIDNRISPGLLAFAVGVCAGAAGAFGLATEIPVSLVGVAIAAAVVPAAAAVGIGIAWSLPTVAIGAFVLLLVNAVAINLTATATFWLLGYRPPEWKTDRNPRIVIGSLCSRVTILLAVFIAVSLIVSGAAIGQQIAYENETATVVENLLAEEYDELGLQSVQVSFGSPETDQREVTVVVSRPADTAPPPLAEEVAAAVSEQTGTETVVTVEYVEQQTAAS
ncbi:TIGR00341 family protein [Haloferacaceae archaeon DSL9]